MVERHDGDTPAPRALILIGHGSRRVSANDEVRALGERLRGRTAGRFERVETAFLELASPSIAEAAQMAVDAGARSILLLPYFLAAGSHVERDIPAAAEAIRARHPRVEVRLLPYLGQADGLLDLLTALATAP